MIALDQVIFPMLLRAIGVRDKVVIDVGCGTGRNWKLLSSLHPAQLRGYDVSRGMLNKLKTKHPDALVRLSEDHRLDATEDHSVDIIVSTLALAHFPDLHETFREWDRVLKPNGHILFTDYHPEALLHGGTITFEQGRGPVQIRHHIHTLTEIRNRAQELGWLEQAFTERRIDAAVKHFYEQQSALALYEKFRNKPIIYGIHFRKG